MLTSTIATILGAIVLLIGLGSRRLETSPVPPAVLACLAGILLGPYVLGIVDLDAWGDRAAILEDAARLTLGIGLVGVALRIPRDYLQHARREMTVLIAVGMLLMWVISSVLVWLILGIPFWLSVLIGAIVTPTDPIAASPVVTGPTAERNLPGRMRNAISFESGANDGLGFLFVFLPLLLLTQGSTGEALTHWLLQTLLWEVVGATLFGVLLGYAAGRMLEAAERLGSIEEDWRLVYTVALALLAVGGGKLIHSDEVLVVFAAGMAFTQTVSTSDSRIEEKGQEAVNRFFSVPAFALFGAAIPWNGWFELGWRGALWAIAILLLRRPPVMLLLRPYLKTIRSTKDALYVGWFGPIAIAAIYYASLSERQTGTSLIWDVVSLVVFASVMVHGLTATSLTRLYGRDRATSSRPSRD